MRLLCEICITADRAIGCRILDQCTENGLVELAPRVIANPNLDAERFCACLHNGNRLWVTIVSDKKCFAISSDCMTKRHRFSCSRGFIKQRGIGDLEPRQVGDHGLKIEEGFKPALREFSLIGCVSSVPT